jgi:hypothetical protein
MRELTVVLSGMMLKLVAHVDLGETHLNLEIQYEGPLNEIAYFC